MNTTRCMKTPDQSPYLGAFIYFEGTHRLTTN